MLTFSEISYVKTSIAVLKKKLFISFLCTVIPVHKKEINSDKVNYRPVFILPNLSKIYENFLYQQLYEHFNSIISPNNVGFEKAIAFSIV